MKKYENLRETCYENHPLGRLPQTPLSERLNGIAYNHHILCSQSHNKPIGVPGCVCLRVIKKEKSL